VKRLLDEGSKVKISVIFRGREITHPEVGMNVLKTVAEELADDALLEKAPSMEGRSLTMIVAPPVNRSRNLAQTVEEVKEPAVAEA